MLDGSDPDSLDIFYVHTDHLGSGHVLTDDSAALLSQEEYFPYGRASDRRDERNRYQYIGVERDEDTGLCMTGPRTYEPLIGRFLQGDPMAHFSLETSPLGYAGARPTAKSDSSGRMPEPIGAEPDPGPADLLIVPDQDAPLPSSTSVEASEYVEQVLAGDRRIMINFQEGISEPEKAQAVGAFQHEFKELLNLSPSFREMVATLDIELRQHDEYVFITLNNYGQPDYSSAAPYHVERRPDGSAVAQYGTFEDVVNVGTRISLESTASLAHELVHAHDYITGNWLDLTTPWMFSDGSATQMLTEAEVKATGLLHWKDAQYSEGRILEEAGRPRPTKYGAWTPHPNAGL